MGEAGRGKTGRRKAGRLEVRGRRLGRRHRRALRSQQALLPVRQRLARFFGPLAPLDAPLPDADADPLPDIVRNAIGRAVQSAMDREPEDG